MRKVTPNLQSCVYSKKIKVSVCFTPKHELAKPQFRNVGSEQNGLKPAAAQKVWKTHKFKTCKSHMRHGILHAPKCFGTRSNVGDFTGTDVLPVVRKKHGLIICLRSGSNRYGQHDEYIRWKEELKHSLQHGLSISRMQKGKMTQNITASFCTMQRCQFHPLLHHWGGMLLSNRCMC